MGARGQCIQKLHALAQVLRLSQNQSHSQSQSQGLSLRVQVQDRVKVQVTFHDQVKPMSKSSPSQVQIKV